MSVLSNRYNLGRQPDGVERVLKAFERLGRKATGGVPTFENNTALKFWLAAVRGRHELNGDRPKADAYTRCLQDFGIALASEEFGVCIDLERVEQLRSYLADETPWDERDGAAFEQRARELENLIQTAEQIDAVDDADETVADEEVVAPEPKTPAEKLAAAVERLNTLRVKAASIDGIQAKLTDIERELEQLDSKQIERRDAIEKLRSALDEHAARVPALDARAARAQERVAELERQLGEARATLEATRDEQRALTIKHNEVNARIQGSTEDLQDIEERFDDLMGVYELFERQRDNATLTSNEREELQRIERALEALQALNL